MESGRDNGGSSVNLRTGPSTNSGKGEQFSSEKKQGLTFSPFTPELASQDHIHFMPNATTTTPPGASATSLPTKNQTHLQSQLHHTSSVTKKGDGSSINSHLEAHAANLFGEAHPSPLRNNLAPSSLSSSSSSQNPFLFPSDATNTTHVSATESKKVHYQVPFEPRLHQPSSFMQQEKGGMTNTSSSTYPAGSLGETHHSSSDDLQGLHSLFAPSTYESLSPGNPFHVPTSTTSKTPIGAAGSQKVVEHHDHGHEWHHHTLPVKEQEDWSLPSHEARTYYPANTHGETRASSSSQQLDPFFTLESAQNKQLDDATGKNQEGAHTFSVREQGHHRKASSNLGTDTVSVVSEASAFSPGKKLGSSVSSFSPASKSSTQDPMHNSVNASSNTKEDTNAPPKLGKDSKLASEFSDDDIPISSMPKHGQQSSDVARKYSSVGVVPETNNRSETQNPPLQVMERPEGPATPSTNRIPQHVFARSKSNTHSSTASNESLFSIQMGNMSFTNDMAWLSKSGEFDKPGDMNVFGASQSNQPPLPPQSPTTKFNDFSQSTSEQFEGSRVTEQKAVETMREVIMETSTSTENKSNGDLKLTNAAILSNRLSNSHCQSHRSDGSTKSFAFKVFTDGEKALSPKHVEEKRKQQQMQSEQQALKDTTPAAAQNPKSNPNASQNKWLSCFTCCH